MKNSAMAIVGAAFAGVSFAIPAYADTAPVLYDDYPATVKAKINETPMVPPTRPASLPARAMDVAGAMPVAMASKGESNSVSGIDVRSNGLLSFVPGNIDVKAGTFENVEQGEIVMMQPKDGGMALTLDEEVAAGDFYYGADGNVYRFIGGVD